jgi:hypothetical protein
MSHVADADLYTDLAGWFHLLTAPEDYADEAEFSLRLLREHVDGPLDTLLELGAGGGNLASHLRDRLRLTLTDLSPAMVEVSRRLNPDTEHVVGDMRTLRLGRTFDAVLIHDAICYMTTEADLRAAMDTAFVHLGPGGVALLEPDFVREIFAPGTDEGGEDAAATPSGSPGRALRYLEWTTDPDPTDTTYQVDYALMLRAEDGTIEVRHDRRIEGLFPRRTWLGLLADVGFEALAVDDPWGRVIFVAKRAGG